MKETVFLNNDREMPLLGLGVYKLPDDVQAEAAVTSAISAGYRMIDTASVYKNEESVGRAIAKCGVPRRIFSSPAKSGTMRSVSAMSRELFPVVSTV